MNEIAVDTFLKDLGYLVDPIDWQFESLPPRPREAVTSARLVCNYPDDVDPLQIFHIALNTPFVFRRILDPICLKSPQANYLFIFSLPTVPALWLVHPKPVEDFPVRVKYRTLRASLTNENGYETRFVNSLHLLPSETDSAGIAQKISYTFDAWTRRRWRRREAPEELDLYQHWRRDISQYRMLSRPESYRLGQSIQAGGPEAEAAREKLVMHNLRLVDYVAKKYQRFGLELIDLIQEGVFGLHRAAKSFDPQLGQFSTYAVTWIKQAVRRAIAEKSRTIDFPVYIHDKYQRLQKAFKRLCDEFGREPSTRELALIVEDEILDESDKQIGWYCLIGGYEPPKETKRKLERADRRIAKLQNWGREPLSLDAYVPPDFPEFARANGYDLPTEPEDELIIADVIERKGISELEWVSQRHLLSRLERILRILNERERVVVEMHFGLRGNSTFTLEELGERFGVTRERIRQIEAKALRKITHPARMDRLNEYLDQPGRKPPTVANKVDADEDEDVISFPIVPLVFNQWASLSVEARWAQIKSALRLKPGEQTISIRVSCIADYLDELETHIPEFEDTEEIIDL